MLDLKQIKADREAGTPGDWYISGSGRLCGGKDSAACRVILEDAVVGDIAQREDLAKHLGAE